MKKYLFFSVVVMVLVLLALFLFPRNNSRLRKHIGGGSKNPPAAISSNEATKRIHQSTSETPYQMTRTSSEDKPPEPMTPALIGFIREHQKYLREKMENRNLPVIVHGRVLDQDDKGISDVSVGLDTSRLFFRRDGLIDGAHFSFSVQTDADGRFFVEGFNALEISVFSLFKEGYVSTRKLRGIHVVEDGSWGSYENPVIFHMWKSRGAEPLIVVKKSMPVDITNGESFSVDLLTGSSSKINNPVTVIINRDDATAIPMSPDTSMMKYDWSFTVEIPDGGVILTEKELAFFAPEKGYARAASISMNKDDPRWSRNMKVNAYIVTGNPPRYSRATFEGTIGEMFKYRPPNPQSDLRWEFYTNPSGSRNLEYDPEKQIRTGNNFAH